MQTPLGPGDTDKETAARLVTAAVSGIPDNLPSANPLLLYKRKKAEQRMDEQLQNAGIRVIRDTMVPDIQP